MMEMFYGSSMVKYRGTQQPSAKRRTPPLSSFELSALAPELGIHSHMQSLMTSLSAFPLTPIGFGSMLDLLALLSVISQPVFIQMSGEVTDSGPHVWKHWGQNSFQSGEIEQKSIWPYSETRERKGWAGQEPTCAWTESVWCFTDGGKKCFARHSPGWISCYSACFRIKAQLSWKSHVLTQKGRKRVTSPKACLCYQVLSMIMLFLGLCRWDLQYWEVTSLFLTPRKKQLRGAPSMGSAGSIGGLVNYQLDTATFAFSSVSRFGVILMKVWLHLKSFNYHFQQREGPANRLQHAESSGSPWPKLWVRLPQKCLSPWAMCLWLPWSGPEGK